VKPYTELTLIGLALLLVGCVSGYERASTIRHNSLASGFCTIHHVALQRTTMYDLTVPVPSDLEEYALKLAYKYPNTAPQYEAKSSPGYRKPVVVRICPVCVHLYNEQIPHLRQ
jgi:hypothetical protein